MASRLINLNPSNPLTLTGDVTGTENASSGVVNTLISSPLARNLMFTGAIAFTGATTFNCQLSGAYNFYLPTSTSGSPIAGRGDIFFALSNSSPASTAPAFLSFVRQGQTILNFGLDTDNQVAIAYSNPGNASQNSQYAPIKAGLIQSISEFSGFASIRLINAAKGGSQGQDQWAVYNTKTENGFPAKTGLHFYSYNRSDANKLYNPFALLDENVVAINAPIRKTLDTAPTSSTAAGEQGDMRICSDGIYMCIAANTWRRVLWQTF